MVVETTRTRTREDQVVVFVGAKKERRMTRRGGVMPRSEVCDVCEVCEVCEVSWVGLSCITPLYQERSQEVPSEKRDK